MIALLKPQRALALVLLALLLTLAACSDGTMMYTRNSEDPTLDDPAMSTRFDRKDLDFLAEKNMSHLFSSRFMQEVLEFRPRRSIAVMPFLNDTSEHIGPQLQALLSDLETSFVNDGRLNVVAVERRGEILAELDIQQSPDFDPKFAAQVGRQIGAHYVVTGKVYDSAERTSDMRRVQYFLFMQVIEVETGVIKWQHKSDVTKALVPL